MNEDNNPSVGQGEQEATWAGPSFLALWPLYLLALLEGAVLLFSEVGRTELFHQQEQQALRGILGYSGMVASLLAPLPVALLGDRRSARQLLLIALSLQAVALLISALPGAGQPLVVSGLALEELASQTIQLLLMVSLLRAVTVRGAYLAVLLFDISTRSGVALAGLPDLGPVLHQLAWITAGVAALGLPLLLYWSEPSRAALPTEGTDRLVFPPLPRWRGFALLLLLAVAAALIVALNLTGDSLLRAAGPGKGHFWVAVPAAGLMLLLPITAYLRFWQPAAFTAAGCSVAAAAGFTHTVVSLFKGGRIFRQLGQELLLPVGDKTLFGLGSLALLRQSFPERLAGWYGLYSGVYAALTLVPWLTLQLVQGSAIFTLALGSLALIVGLALWRVSQR